VQPLRKNGHKKSDCWQLDKNKNKRPKNVRRGNAEHGHAAISGDSGEDNDGPEFLMCVLRHDEEEGSTVTDYKVPVGKHVEEETFDFMMEYEEEESKGSVGSIEEIDIEFPNIMKLLLDQNVCIADTDVTVHATPNPSAMINKSEKK
jgi:hypothetical protein